MNTSSAEYSILQPIISRYLALQRALGKSFKREQWILESLDRWLVNAQVTDLDAGSFTAWCNSKQHLASGVRRSQMLVIRNFCLYRRRRESDCFVPDLLSFPAHHQPLQPHIFTEEQITRLLHVADRLEPTPLSPIRPQVFRLAIVLLYTTGLRRAELLRLCVGDYDPRQHSLLVQHTKFHKSRHLPLSGDTAREIAHYLDVRRQHALPLTPETPLICNENGKAYSGVGFWQVFRALCHQTGIRTAEGRWPRVHDLRHTFAVNALLRWYRTGIDIHAKLPLLATYMGHVSIVSTEYYLHFIDEVASTACDRFNDKYGAVVTPPPKRSGSEQ